jgi:predicted transcriptional regulator of viral defense system
MGFSDFEAGSLADGKLRGSPGLEEFAAELLRGCWQKPVVARLSHKAWVRRARRYMIQVLRAGEGGDFSCDPMAEVSLIVAL